MRLSLYIFTLLFMPFFAHSSTVTVMEYQAYNSTYNATTGWFSSQALACTALGPMVGYKYTGYSGTIGGDCYDNTGGPVRKFGSYRSRPVDCPYGSTDGKVCDPPPPDPEPEPDECKEGDLFPARGADSSIITGADGTKIVASQPPTNVCYNSCAYSGAPGETRTTGCYVSGADSSMGYCNYVIKGTGQSCSTENYQFAVSGDPLNPPPDPDEPPPVICPPGWGMSGTTCYPLPPDPDGGDGGSGGDGGDDGSDGGDDGSSGGGGGGGGGSDGGSDGGDDGGSDGGDSGSGPGTDIPIGGGDSGSGGTPGSGDGDGLFKPQQGSFDGYLKDADDVIADYKTKLRNVSDKYKGLIDSKLNINLSTAGGGLPCFSFTYRNSNQQVCLSTYEAEASTLRNVILLLAALAALFIVFSRRSD